MAHTATQVAGDISSWVLAGSGGRGRGQPQSLLIKLRFKWFKNILTPHRRYVTLIDATVYFERLVIVGINVLMLFLLMFLLHSCPKIPQRTLGQMSSLPLPLPCGLAPMPVTVIATRVRI